jgi:hypothetical protein
MAVTVALFLGMTVSAEEIIKDRRILKREKFLNLSNWAYINSKVVFLFFLSAMQTLLFVVISNAILEIHGLTIKFWLILFAASFWGNIVGLLISSMMNSVVTIYISIPLVLIPLLLFSGTVINFANLNKVFANDKYCPFIGDVMISRWAFEALMTTQFSDNLYEKYFFETDKTFENANYYSTSYYDKLEEIARFLLNHKNDTIKTDFVDRRFRILNNEIIKIEKLINKPCPVKDKLNKDDFDQETLDKLLSYLYYNIKVHYNKIVNKARYQHDSIYYNLVEKYGSDEAVSELKNQNFNLKVEDFVCNKNELTNIKETENELIRNYRPIFQIPESNIGRAQFYSAEKIIGKFHIKTIWFNITIMWIYTLFLYILLISQIFDYERRKLKRLSK